MEWFRLIIEFVSVLLVNGILFFTINKKLKKLEVKEKEVDIVKKQDDEWQELYEEEKTKRQEAESELKKAQTDREDAVKRALLLEMKNQRLTWYRCEVDGCINRKPPHVFSSQGVELGAPQYVENDVAL